MLDESLPQLNQAPIPMQTHILRLEERTAKGKALRDIAARDSKSPGNHLSTGLIRSIYWSKVAKVAWKSYFRFDTAG